MQAGAATGGSAKRERLAERRKALGLTQEDLADLLGVERSTVVRWERGETEPLPWIRPKLARALRVSADRLEELLGGRALAGEGGGRGGVAAVPRQLPAAVADFTGRAAELEALTEILDQEGTGAPGTVVISAIGGMAGVGKTALALHWAHHVAHGFVDGQLYVNLRGFDPSRAPAAPEEAVRGFLDALGVSPERIPPLPDAQAAMYRSLVADQKMLIVLDNAWDEQQVRPLLPASPASVVVVTSRNQLSGLAAAGARLLSLDVLTQAEAIRLLTARVGHAAAAAEPEAIAGIADLCACLPLAVAVAGARAAGRPRFPISALAAELRGAADRLDALDAGDPAASVRAVFSWSYQQLSAEAARMFRLLGLHPGPDISALAAASLAGRSESETRRLLAELTRAHLITEHVSGRFAFHDLLRGYAASQSRAQDSQPDCEAATGRLLDHYLHTAHSATLLLNPGYEQYTIDPPRPGTVPEQLVDHEQILQWFETEHHVLLAAIALADSSGLDAYAWQLPQAIGHFLQTRGHHQERIATGRAALAAATRLGDTAGQAIASRRLADAYVDLGDHDQALGCYTTSLELHQRLGNRPGEAKVQLSLSGPAEGQGRYADALAHSEQALRLFRAAGHKAGEAQALNNVGWFHCLLGHYEQARALCRQALALNAEVRHRHFEGSAWDSVGYAEHHLGNFDEAAACYLRALGIFRECGDRYLEATILTHLGDTRRAMGQLPPASEAWQQALAILDDLDHPDADTVRARLADIDGQNPDEGEPATR
jgi:tetratricopeptide (TPR) repeat protein/transcriptional regulator with XRE-family HTH domain